MPKYFPKVQRERFLRISQRLKRRPLAAFAEPLSPFSNQNTVRQWERCDFTALTRPVVTQRAAEKQP